MPDYKKIISVSVTDDEYAQLKALAKTHQMEPDDFIKSLSLLFIDNKSLYESISNIEAKKNLEDELLKVSNQLEKKQRFIDLLLRSIYSTQMRLEGQFKKYRLEASKELEKDFERISIIVDAAKAKK